MKGSSLVIFALLAVSAVFAGKTTTTTKTYTFTTISTCNTTVSCTYSDPSTYATTLNQAITSKNSTRINSTLITSCPNTPVVKTTCPTAPATIKKTYTLTTPWGTNCNTSVSCTYDDPSAYSTKLNGFISAKNFTAANTTLLQCSTPAVIASKCPTTTTTTTNSTINTNSTTSTNSTTTTNTNTTTNNNNYGYTQATSGNCLATSFRAGSQTYTFRGLTTAQQQTLLAYHNYWRNITASGNSPGMPAATNMKEMVWDPEVAANAQWWADHCYWGHNPNAERTTTKFSYLGQNLAQMGSTVQSTNVDWYSLVKMWYDEVTLWSSSDSVSSYKFNSATGHYTQLVWATSSALGCGFVQFKDTYNWNYLVCNYGSGGNYIGMPIYSTSANTCTKSTVSPALCK